MRDINAPKIILAMYAIKSLDNVYRNELIDSDILHGLTL